jgi:hypothetical protein
VFLGFAIDAHHFDISSARGVRCLPSEAHFPHWSRDLVNNVYVRCSFNAQ